VADDGKLLGIQNRHNAWIDGQTKDFETLVSEITKRAVARVQVRLAAKLGEAKLQGAVGSKPAEVKLFRQISRMLDNEMRALGIDDAVEMFVQEFGYQVNFLEETFDLLGLPRVKLTAAQRSASLVSLQEASHGALLDTVRATAALAQRDVLAQAGRISFNSLADLVESRTKKGIEEAKGLADTAMVTYHRSLNATAMQEIEKQMGVQRYRPFGPKDKYNRPFCAALLNKTQVYTRKQIDRMNNGQLPEPFLTFGGYRCRHQWILVPKGEK
jgi:hypothetical protein